MTEKVLDIGALKRLMEVVGGDPADFDELRVDFLESVPKTLGNLKQADLRADLTAMRIDAHTLKSNARDFGAMRLSEMCKELEAKCREGQPFDSSGLIAEICDEEQLVCSALKQVKASELVRE